MASTVSVGESQGVHEDSGSTQLIRVILADTQAIFRAGLRKIFRVRKTTSALSAKPRRCLRLNLR